MSSFNRPNSRKIYINTFSGKILEENLFLHTWDYETSSHFAVLIRTGGGQIKSYSVAWNDAATQIRRSFDRLPGMKNAKHYSTKHHSLQGLLLDFPLLSAVYYDAVEKKECAKNLKAFSCFSDFKSKLERQQRELAMKKQLELDAAAEAAAQDIYLAALASENLEVEMGSW